MKISATIITLNEEPHLARALASLGACDEIVVVDSGSTDDTREIALRAGARVIENAWPGYAAQKNFAAAAATHDWILSLDADEEVSPELARSLARWKGSEPQRLGYAFARRARYLGRWIWHGGWYPDRKVRLFDRRAGRWIGKYVHESVAVEGPWGQLDGDLLHYTCDSFTEHVERVNRYTSLAAQEMIAAGRQGSLARVLVSPPWTFFRTYFFRLGFLDGFQGLLVAAMAAFYVFSKHVKVWLGRP